MLLTVGTAAATVATAAALAPAMAASAVSVHDMLASSLGTYIGRDLHCWNRMAGRACIGLKQKVWLVTSGAALGDGEPLVEVGAGHRRHGRERDRWDVWRKRTH
jgi:hypothetical protein